jgi:membrane-associated phospholipid phosphatase
MVDVITIFFATKLHIGIVLAGVLFFVSLSKERKVLCAYRTLIALPISFLENIQPLIAHIPDNGFPSEHTLLVATISVLVYTEHKVFGLILGVLTLGVGLARVQANVHHGIDVVGSIGIAVASVCITYHLVTWLQKSYADRLPFLQKTN